MKIYYFGAEDAPVLLLLPGTCCHWKSNFGAVIPLLADSFRVLCVSYDGFDETEQTEFPTMLEETEKIEAYLKTHCGGHIRAAYGWSLGGSFVGLLAARQNIHMDCGILGSSDLDQASPLAASLQTDFLLPLIYPVVRDGKFKAKFLQKRLAQFVASFLAEIIISIAVADRTPVEDNLRGMVRLWFQQQRIHVRVARHSGGFCLHSLGTAYLQPFGSGK